MLFIFFIFLSSLLVVARILCLDLLIGEHATPAPLIKGECYYRQLGSNFVPWAILLGVGCLDEACVPCLQVYITGPVLGTIPEVRRIFHSRFNFFSRKCGSGGLTSICFGSFCETQHLFSASGKIHLVSVRNKERYAKTSSYKYSPEPLIFFTRIDPFYVNRDDLCTMNIILIQKS